MFIKKPSDVFMVLPFFRPKNASRSPSSGPENGFFPNKIKNHLIAWIGEFVGTFMFLFFAFSATQVGNEGASTDNNLLSRAPNISVLLYISLAFGFSLAVNVWCFYRITGGIFNPAVTLGMCLIGAIGYVRGMVIVTAQIVGAIASAAVVSALFPGPLLVRTSLAPGTSITRGLFIEMFLTAELVFTIFMLAAEKHKGTFLAPLAIGLALFVAEMSGVYYTGGSLNPARSFGPDVVSRTFDSYHWIYWLGPSLGSILAAVFYRTIKYLEYETVNPGQDFDEHEHRLFNTGQDPASPVAVRRPNITPYYTSTTLASLEGGQMAGSAASPPGSKQQETAESVV